MHSQADKSSAGEVPELGSAYFEFQALFGATKHAGGLAATRELLELCHVDEGSYVLDVGCGVGMTPVYMAKELGCRVVGVDLRESMIEQARDRAKREGVEQQVEFRVADARDLPFEDALFDAVTGESVTSLLVDKQTGINEYVRVTKPGGYVGINEMTWLKPGPPPALVDYYFRTTGSRPETSDAWEELLHSSGLTNVVVRPRKMQNLSEYSAGLQRFGFRDLLSTGRRFLSLAITSPAFREFARAAIPSVAVIRAIFAYLGYGIYVGRKEPSIRGEEGSTGWQHKTGGS
jgi:arsenite methyltransferase